MVDIVKASGRAKCGVCIKPIKQDEWCVRSNSGHWNSSCYTHYSCLFKHMNKIQCAEFDLQQAELKLEKLGERDDD